MRVILILIQLIIANHAFAFNNDNFIGKWECAFNEYTETLTLFEDGKYSKVNVLYGSILQDHGLWQINSKVLFLNRQVHINNGDKNESQFTFNRKIINATAVEFTTEHNNGDDEIVTTICKKV